MKAICAAICICISCSLPAAAQSSTPAAVRVTDGDAVPVLLALDNLVRPDPSPRNRVCSAQPDDEGELTRAVAAAGSDRFWARVRFFSGSCNGLEGWMSLGRIQPR